MAGRSLDRRTVLAAGLGFSTSGFRAAPEPQSAIWNPFNRIDPSTLTLTFEDSFKSFDRAKGPHGKGRWMTNFANGPEDGLNSRSLPNNGEEQVYVDPELHGLGLDPFRLTPNGLAIQVERTPARMRARLWNRPYTSGVITTRQSFSQLYGYFEIKARLPLGKGFWPAFWLLPANGSWPPELDVLESLGRDPWSTYATVHSKHLNQLGKRIRTFTNLTAAPHSFGVAWTAEELTWYFDRREVSRMKTPADMHTPMYLLANVAVGGKWAMSPDATTRFPGVMEIHAIRAWKLPKG